MHLVPLGKNAWPLVSYRSLYKRIDS